MLRPSASTRRVFGVALALSIGTGIGFGAYTLGSSAGANSMPFPRAATSTATSGPAATSGSATTSAPETAPAPEASASTPLTLEGAMAVAAQAAAPGRVVEWDEDNEPTGLRYDVTLLHDDGTTTDVEVDTVTGQVTSINHDNDWD
jgi:hypothetical protein